MSKRLSIPPIKPNPRHGKETVTDASVMWGGAKLPKEPKPSRGKRDPERSTPKRSTPKRSRQRKFTITNEEQLQELVKLYSLNATAIVNLALSELAQVKLKK